MHRRQLLLALGGMGCAPRAEVIADYCYRYKFTVSVDGALCSGESVVRVRWTDNTPGLFDGGGQFNLRVWAEAPIADLGKEHGLLFALLCKPRDGFLFPAYTLPRVALSFFEHSNEERPAILRRLDAGEISVILPPEEWPVFVRFTDLAEPASARVVRPRLISSVYGQGAEIVSVSMSIVEGEPTERILDVLPWIRNLKTSLSGAGTVLANRSGPAGLMGLYFRMWGLHA